MLGLECPSSTSPVPRVTVLRQDLLLGSLWCLCALEALIFDSPFYFGCGLRKEKQEQSPFTGQCLGSASPLFHPSQQTSLALLDWPPGIKMTLLLSPIFHDSPERPSTKQCLCLSAHAYVVPRAPALSPLHRLSSSPLLQLLALSSLPCSPLGSSSPDFLFSL